METIRLVNTDGIVSILELTFSQLCRYTKQMTNAQYEDFYCGKNVSLSCGIQIKIVNMDNLKCTKLF